MSIMNLMWNITDSQIHHIGTNKIPRSNALNIKKFKGGFHEKINA